jgi:hypothetical protein
MKRTHRTKKGRFFLCYRDTKETVLSMIADAAAGEGFA